MASYATIPADESAQPLVVNKQTSGLKRLVAGAALASFVLGVLAATAVQSASTPVTTSLTSADVASQLPPGDYFDVQLRSVHGRDNDVCLTLNPEEAKKAYLPGDKVPLELHRCYDKSAYKRGQIFSFEGGVDSPRHLTSWPGSTKLCLATDSDSLWFTPCNDKDKEQDFSFEEVDADKVTIWNGGFPDYKPHGVFGNIKSSGGNCFGVDYSLKSGISNPTMTDCGKDYKTKGEFEFYNAWELIQH
jgi:hypothetical protein